MIWTTSLGGCGLFRVELPDSGPDLAEIERAPSAAFAEYNRPGLPLVEYVAPAAVIRGKPGQEGENGCRYDVVVEACLRGPTGPGGVDVWCYSRGAGLLRISGAFGAEYDVSMRGHLGPWGQGLSRLLQEAPCAHLRVTGESVREPDKIGEGEWRLYRWSYPIVTDRPIREDHVTIWAEGDVYWRGCAGPALKLTTGSAPVVDPTTVSQETPG